MANPEARFLPKPTAVPLADLKAAVGDRVEDARVLLVNDRFTYAVITAVYALEIALMVKICERLDLDSLPAVFEIHELRALLHMAGLAKKITSHPQVVLNYTKLEQEAKRVSELRYRPDAQYNQAQATDCSRS